MPAACSAANGPRATSADLPAADGRLPPGFVARTQLSERRFLRIPIRAQETAPPAGRPSPSRGLRMIERMDDRRRQAHIRSTDSQRRATHARRTSSENFTADARAFVARSPSLVDIARTFLRPTRRCSFELAVFDRPLRRRGRMLTGAGFAIGNPLRGSVPPMKPANLRRSPSIFRQQRITSLSPLPSGLVSLCATSVVRLRGEQSHSWRWLPYRSLAAARRSFVARPATCPPAVAQFFEQCRRLLGRRIIGKQSRFVSLAQRFIPLGRTPLRILPRGPDATASAA